MRRATVTIPDELEKALESYVRDLEFPPSLAAVMQAALKEYLSRRGYPASGGAHGLRGGADLAGRQDGCGDGHRGSPLILFFPNTRGKVRRRDSVMRSLHALLAAAVLPPEVRFHDLRHTAGTLALRQGVPLHTVSRMLGHSDPAMTLRLYAHLLDDMRDDAARAMDDLF